MDKHDRKRHSRICHDSDGTIVIQAWEDVLYDSLSALGEDSHALHVTIFSAVPTSGRYPQHLLQAIQGPPLAQKQH